MVHAVALKLMCRTRFVSFRSVFRIRRVFGLMEIPRFNWHLMTSLFTRDRKEPKKAIHTHRESFLRGFVRILWKAEEEDAACMRVCRARFSCISLESDTKSDGRELDEEKEETRDRDGEKEKKK